MLIETKNKTINLVLRTRKIVDIANLLKNKNFEDAFIRAYSELDMEALSKIIFKLAEDENGNAVFDKSDEVYDYIDECRKEEIMPIDLYKKIAEALNDEGFFKKKMSKKELTALISNPLSTIDVNKIIKSSAEKAMENIVSAELQ